MCSTVGVTQIHGLKYPEYVLAHLWWFSRKWSHIWELWQFFINRVGWIIFSVKLKRNMLMVQRKLSKEIKIGFEKKIGKCDPIGEWHKSLNQGKLWSSVDLVIIWWSSWWSSVDLVRTASTCQSPGCTDRRRMLYWRLLPWHMSLIFDLGFKLSRC